MRVVYLIIAVLAICDVTLARPHIKGRFRNKRSLGSDEIVQRSTDKSNDHADEQEAALSTESKEIIPTTEQHSDDTSIEKTESQNEESVATEKHSGSDDSLIEKTESQNEESVATEKHSGADDSLIEHTESKNEKSVATEEHSSSEEEKDSSKERTESKNEELLTTKNHSSSEEEEDSSKERTESKNEEAISGDQEIKDQATSSSDIIEEMKNLDDEEIADPSFLSKLQNTDIKTIMENVMIPRSTASAMRTYVRGVFHALFPGPCNFFTNNFPQHASVGQSYNVIVQVSCVGTPTYNYDVNVFVASHRNFVIQCLKEARTPCSLCSSGGGMQPLSGH